MNAKRRKQSFQPALENNELERRVVLSVTAGSAAAARALQAQQRAAILEMRAERRAVQLERRAELQVNRQITRAFNQFSRDYNFIQNQYMRNVRLGRTDALAAFQAARTNGLNTLANRLGTVYARFPQGTGTLPSVDAILGSIASSPNGNPGTIGGIGTGIGAGTGTGTIDPGTPLSLLASLGNFDSQNLTGRNLLSASRGAINASMQSVLGSVSNYLSANPLLGTQVSTGFNNPTGLGTSSGVNTGGFGGTAGLGNSPGFVNPTGYTSATSFYGSSGTVGLGTGTNPNGTGVNGQPVFPTTSSINSGVFNPFLGGGGNFTLGGPSYVVAAPNPSLIVGTTTTGTEGTTTTDGSTANNPDGTTTTNTGTSVTTTPGSGANNNNYQNNFYQGTGISPGIDNGFNNGLTFGFNTGLGLGFTSAGTAALPVGFSGGLAIR
jgi:hypothetical protein